MMRMAVEENHKFLNRLVGRWLLTGKMGEVALRQEVEARWILGGNYVWMHCRSVTADDNPTAGYEAIYLFGFDESAQVYVMHLFDTTEVPSEYVLGKGAREGDSIPFLFAYGDIPFYNILTWHAERGGWSFRQTYEKEGEMRNFATKEMVRIS